MESIQYVLICPVLPNLVHPYLPYVLCLEKDLFSDRAALPECVNHNHSTNDLTGSTSAVHRFWFGINHLIPELTCSSVSHVAHQRPPSGRLPCQF
jgi:hypothetical protein